VTDGVFELANVVLESFTESWVTARIDLIVNDVVVSTKYATGTIGGVVVTFNYVKSLSSPREFLDIKVKVSNTNAYNTMYYRFKWGYGSRYHPSPYVAHMCGLITDSYDAPKISTGQTYMTATLSLSHGGYIAQDAYYSFFQSITSGTPVNAGTHVCELDELCNTWVS
jgi:hypothetical protein